jgi:hypothetical protein
VQPWTRSQDRLRPSKFPKTPPPDQTNQYVADILTIARRTSVADRTTVKLADVYTGPRGFSLVLRVLRENRYAHSSPASEDFRNNTIPDTPHDRSSAAISPTFDQSQFRRRNLRTGDLSISSAAPDGIQLQRPTHSVLELSRNKSPRSPNITIGDSTSGSAISEDSRSGLMSDALNDPDLVHCSSVKFPELPTCLPSSEMV